MAQRILKLTVKRRWFDMIASGNKKEEYREIKPYWDSRLNQQYDVVVFKNGYSSTAPTVALECKGIEKKNANSAWCGGETPYCYAIKLGNIITNH